MTEIKRHSQCSNVSMLAEKVIKEMVRLQEHAEIMETVNALLAEKADMLEALKAIDAISTDQMRFDNPKEWALLDAAIAKAEGKQS